MGNNLSFKEALQLSRINITAYDPSKARPVITALGAMDIKKFSKIFSERLGEDIADFPEISRAIHNPSKMESLLEQYALDNNLVEEDDDDKIVIPKELEKYTLNINIAAKRGEDEFFLTTEGEFMSEVSGRYYINKCAIPPVISYKMARPVLPEYRPRSKPGVFDEMNGQTKETRKIFNTYLPPEWALWRKENWKEWEALPEKPPKLILKLLKHVIPNAEERRYFYAWLYASMFTRSYVYLVLCGAPGAGKNRLKLVLRALHGIENTVDGKKSTLTERFNSQLSHGTVAWFDELKYDTDMENNMKEIQNDYISIERKGVDATRSSTIYASMVISNNKPRDNYIAFDARKFAPLVIGNSNLLTSMAESEIDELTKKVEVGKEDFDVRYVAQIAKWIIRVGRRNLKSWPTLEYKGPYFWTLAHTSMTRWQKKSISALLDKRSGVPIGWDEEEKAHLWSKVEEKIGKRNNNDSSVSFPDYSSVKAFFDIFRDSKGEKAFDTKVVPGANILGDFWIYPLTKDLKVVTESDVLQKREKEMTDEEKEIYSDL